MYSTATQLKLEVFMLLQKQRLEYKYAKSKFMVSSV